MKLRISSFYLKIPFLIIFSKKMSFFIYVTYLENIRIQNVKA